MVRLPQRLNSFYISKGKPNEEQVSVKKPEPMFIREPFPNYMEAAIMLNDKTIMGYDHFGRYTISTMADESKRRAFAQMEKDSLIVGLVNDRRRRNY